MTDDWQKLRDEAAELHRINSKLEHLDKADVKKFGLSAALEIHAYKAGADFGYEQGRKSANVDEFTAKLIEAQEKELSAAKEEIDELLAELEKLKEQK